MVAARTAGHPIRRPAVRAGVEVVGQECVEATAGQAELGGGLGGSQCAVAKRVENMANKSGRMPLTELLVLFIAGEYPTPPSPPFRRPRYARPPPRRAGGSK